MPPAWSMLPVSISISSAPVGCYLLFLSTREMSFIVNAHRRRADGGLISRLMSPRRGREVLLQQCQRIRIAGDAAALVLHRIEVEPRS